MDQTEFLSELIRIGTEYWAAAAEHEDCAPESRDSLAPRKRLADFAVFLQTSMED